MSTEQVPNFVLSQNLQKICEHTLSLKDICWLLFTLNDINLTTLQIYNHYNTIMDEQNSDLLAVAYNI